MIDCAVLFSSPPFIPHPQLFQKVILPRAPIFFSHWRQSVRHLFHRLLIYKTYRSRRMYLPVLNSCEWLAILNGILQKRYNHDYEEAEEVSMPESRKVSIASMLGPSIADPMMDAVYRKQRSQLFHTDLSSKTFLKISISIFPFHTHI